MLDEWKKRREFASKIAANEEKVANLNRENDPDWVQRTKVRQTLSRQRENRDIFESRVAIQKARKRALEIPSRQDKPTWWEDDNDEYGGVPPEALTVWLTETGRIGVLKLVAEDRKRIWSGGSKSLHRYLVLY
jgi:hypothetical protein